MRLHHSTLGALLAASLTATAVGCAGPATESGAGAAFMNGADEAEFQEGLTAQQAGNQAEAERRFKRALAANPNYLSARISLGNLQLAQGRDEEASATFDTALATRASSIDAQLGAAEARLRLNRCDEATALSKKVVAQGKSSATPVQLSAALTFIGRCSVTQGQGDAAASFQEAILANGSNTEARLALAQLFMATGSSTDVVNALARAAEYERKPLYLLRIGRMMTAVHQARRAVTVLTRAQQYAPADAEIALALAKAQLDVGDANLALQTLSDISARSGELLPAQVLMGRAELLAGHDEAAQRLADKVLATEPSQPDALYLMALLQLGHDDKLSAERSLRQALATAPQAVEARTKLAELLAARAAWGEVADLLEADAERAWAPSAWTDMLLQAYQEGGRFDLSLPMLSRRANERGSDPEAHAAVVEQALAHAGILAPALVVTHAQAAFDASGGSLPRYRLALVDALAAADRVRDALAIVEAGLKALPGNRELVARKQALQKR